MIHERGQEGINSYIQLVSERVTKGAEAGEFDIGEPVTEDALVAVGISCGMKADEILQAEAKGR